MTLHHTPLWTFREEFNQKLLSLCLAVPLLALLALFLVLHLVHLIPVLHLLPVVLALLDLPVDRVAPAFLSGECRTRQVRREPQEYILLWLQYPPEIPSLML
jgi:hypothetical protein